MSEHHAAHARRAFLARTIFETVTIDEVAGAIAMATEWERVVYVERRPGGWRWSPAHRGGSYPLSRITARLFGLDRGVVIGFRTVDGYAVLAKDPDRFDPPLEWHFLSFDGPTSADEVERRLDDVSRQGGTHGS